MSEKTQAGGHVPSFLFSIVKYLGKTGKKGEKSKTSKKRKKRKANQTNEASDQYGRGSSWGFIFKTKKTTRQESRHPQCQLTEVTVCN